MAPLAMNEYSSSTQKNRLLPRNMHPMLHFVFVEITLTHIIVVFVVFIVVDVVINTRVMFFTAFVSMVAGLAFGLIPALHGVRAGVHDTLKAEGAGSTSSISRQRLQR